MSAKEQIIVGITIMLAAVAIAAWLWGTPGLYGSVLTIAALTIVVFLFLRFTR